MTLTVVLGSLCFKVMLAWVPVHLLASFCQKGGGGGSVGHLSSVPPVPIARLMPSPPARGGCSHLSVCQQEPSIVCLRQPKCFRGFCCQWGTPLFSMAGVSWPCLILAAHINLWTWLSPPGCFNGALLWSRTTEHEACVPLLSSLPNGWGPLPKFGRP